MESTSFMRVDEVAQELGISKSYAYKIVQKLNAELKEKGFMTISGRVNKQYFMERTCYGVTKKEGD
ncbi:DNA-binding protein [uncultured Ruminococcus sp.]|uniref:DNA-binding protein n=1 Tax=uncultured Ruminococcus sp. TaxID=165186 RepID=UPI0025F389A5|nr:DNA-binding protein [uncultured Ruminococcus sp.]MCI6824090.1 DNA-binding protein [Ruminococcus bromii]